MEGMDLTSLCRCRDSSWPLDAVALALAHYERLKMFRRGWLGGSAPARESGIPTSGFIAAFSRRASSTATSASLHPQHLPLDFVHAKVAADELVVILRLHSVRPEQTCPLRQAGIVGRQQARIAEGAQILAREEREAAEGSKSADGTRLVRGADGLGGILDDRHARPRRFVQNRVELRAQAEEVNRDYCPGPRCDGGRDA